MVGTENLLLICAAALGAALLILYPVRTSEVTPKVSERRSGQMDGGTLSAVRRSELVRLLGSMAALVAIVAAIIDVQFNQIVDEHFPDVEQKTAFFGQVLALLSAFALLFQVVATPRILRSMGVVSALLFLPISMALGSAAVLMVPGLAAGILVKMGDGSFRHAIHKSATEILYLPIPADIKRRTKMLLDTTVDNLATGAGALLVLVMLRVFGVSYEHLSFLSLALIAVWLALIARSRGAYIDTFRSALQRREIDLGELSVDITEAATIDGLIGNLNPALPRRGPLPVGGIGRAQERRLSYALDMLAPVRAERLVEPVAKLLTNSSSAVRQKALQILRNQTGRLPVTDIEALQTDEDLEVRIEALHFMCEHGQGDRLSRLNAALRGGDKYLRGAAVGYIAGYGTDEEHDLIDEAVIRQAFADSEDDVPTLVQAARILGSLREPARRPYVRVAMEQLMDHPVPDVALQAIESLGRLRDPEYVPWLLQKLNDRAYRAAARAALAAYGSDILPELNERVMDRELDLPSRTRAARAMAEIVDQSTVDALMEQLDRADFALQYHLLKSLSKLRNKSPHLHFDAQRLGAEIRRAARAYYDAIQILDMSGSDENGRASALLTKALRERREQALERIFRLLALQYAAKDMYNAYLGMVSGDRATRASALEFLDNVLDRETKEYLLPLLEQISTAAAIEHGHRVFGARFASRGAALDDLLSGDDPWLRACAIYSLTDGDPSGHAEAVRSMEKDPDRIVSETAAMVRRVANL